MLIVSPKTPPTLTTPGGYPCTDMELNFVLAVNSTNITALFNFTRNLNLNTCIVLAVILE